MYTYIFKSFLSLVWKLPMQTDSCYPVCILYRLNLSLSLLALKSCPCSLLAECLQICHDHFEVPSRRPRHCHLRFLSPGTKTGQHLRLEIGRAHSVSVVRVWFQPSCVLTSASHPHSQLCRQTAWTMSRTTSTRPPHQALPLCPSTGKSKQMFDVFI